MGKPITRGLASCCLLLMLFSAFATHAYANIAVQGIQGATINDPLNDWNGVHANVYTNSETVVQHDRYKRNGGLHVSSIYVEWDAFKYVETGWSIDETRHYTDGSDIQPWKAWAAYQKPPMTSQKIEWGPQLSQGQWYYFEINNFASVGEDPNTHEQIYQWRFNRGGVTGSSFQVVMPMEKGRCALSSERVRSGDTNWAFFSDAAFKKSTGGWFMFTEPQVIEPDIPDDVFSGHWHSGFTGERDFSVDAD